MTPVDPQIVGSVGRSVDRSALAIERSSKAAPQFGNDLQRADCGEAVPLPLLLQLLVGRFLLAHLRIEYSAKRNNFVSAANAL